jgi:hypothetical protein
MQNNRVFPGPVNPEDTVNDFPSVAELVIDDDPHELTIKDELEEYEEFREGAVSSRLNRKATV